MVKNFKLKTLLENWEETGNKKPYNECLNDEQPYGLQLPDDLFINNKFE